MGRYLLKRIGTAILTVLFVFVLNFVLIRLAPGDPVTILAGQDNPSQELIDIMKAKYGLDKSIPEQLAVYLGNVIKGDLGTSIIYGRPVMDIIMERLGPTLMLSLTGAVIALVLGTLLAIWASRNPGGVVDNIISYIAYVLYSMPGFWLGLIMILFFASNLGWLPTAGMENARAGYTGIKHVLDVAKHLVLPASALALVGVPAYFRIGRSSMMQVIKSDYVNTFKAAGLDKGKIYRKYLFREAMLPTITTFGIRLAYIIGGSAATEIVFAWPGMGTLVLSAISSRDYPLLMGNYLILSISVAVWMILVDLIYAVADPRIRLS